MGHSDIAAVPAELRFGISVEGEAAFRAFMGRRNRRAGEMTRCERPSCVTRFFVAVRLRFAFASRTQNLCA